MPGKSSRTWKARLEKHYTLTVRIIFYFSD